MNEVGFGEKTQEVLEDMEVDTNSTDDSIDNEIVQEYCGDTSRVIRQSR